MDTDNQLLESYVSYRSERAFRELVERHINLVHSAGGLYRTGPARQTPYAASRSRWLALHLCALDDCKRPAFRGQAATP